MAEGLRFDPPSATTSRRWTIGVLVSSDCSRVAAVLVSAVGQGVGVQAEIGEGMTAQVPRETSNLFGHLADGPVAGAAGSPPEAIGALTALRSQLAELAASVIDALLAQAQLPPARISAVGVHDPGLWSCAAQPGYVGLCDAGRLAELTGMNIIDAFPARDVARGGLGGPLAALAEWVFLKDPRCDRLLIDLGRTTRMTYLPSVPAGQGAPNLRAFDAGPGMRMLDLLTQRLTNGEQPFDPGGRMAVQGRRIAELIDHWLADPYLRRSLPRWHPRGVRPERFLIDGLRMAVEHGWSVRDLLCTATHFIVETIDLAIRRLPDDCRGDEREIVLTGGGQHNGLLLRELTARLAGIPLRRLAELNIAAEAFGPACVALLALFYLDQVPANLPEVTGADVPRVLGRLTPGSPQSWQRLVSEMAGSKPAVRPLRSAL